MLTTANSNALPIISNAPYVTTFPNWAKKILKNKVFDSYSQDDLCVTLVKNSPENGHPMVFAQAKNCIRWIQFVQVNHDPGISHSKVVDKQWVFIDTSPENHKQKNPLYSNFDAVFYDNPCWGAPGPNSKMLSWRGVAFPVIYRRGVFSIGNGFVWGFDWLPKAKYPLSVSPTAIESAHFHQLSDLFQDQFDFDKIIQKASFLNYIQKCHLYCTDFFGRHF